MQKKPVLEKISPEFGKSILVRQHDQEETTSIAFWHFHPEVELIYINKGNGKTHIGNHLSYFNNSQLLLIGANLPHNGFTDRLTKCGKETLIQFKPEIFGDFLIELPEMAKIKQLLIRAKKGIRFKAESKKIIGPKIEEIKHLNGFNRVVKLLEVLQDLALAEDYEILNSDGYAFETKPQDSEKIDLIFKYINDNFKNQIYLDEIADKASMTVPAFCRYFKRVTGKTFTKLVNEYRVVHATKLLTENQMSITDVCYECGFNNFSHFNKLFKEFTGKSASKYRGEVKKIIQ
ncbi:AraC family transcriptional regulator [Pontimicrobium sp. IMCC45349]|uniref:AraC family transcriptional regulator n=1 Tax=Pontimicrobium sp. IMCC45349 TaxID=3391574 RepID=UPI0039A125B1